MGPGRVVMDNDVFGPPRPGRRVLRAWRAGGRVLAGHVALCYLDPGSRWPAACFKYGVPVELHHMHVEPGFRGQGIGTKLLAAAVAWALRQEATVVLCAEPYGVKAPPLEAVKTFYRAGGFKHLERGIMVRYPV